MPRSPPEMDFEKSEGHRNKPTRSRVSSRPHLLLPKKTDSRSQSWSRPPMQMGKVAGGEARREYNPWKNCPLESAEQSRGIDGNQSKLRFPFPPRHGRPSPGYSSPGTQRLQRSRPTSVRR